MKKFLIAVAAAVPVVGTALVSASAQVTPSETHQALTPAQRVTAANKKAHADVIFQSMINEHAIAGTLKPGLLSRSSNHDIEKTLDK